MITYTKRIQMQTQTKKQLLYYLFVSDKIKRTTVKANVTTNLDLR